jgi:hypothetical protein
MAQNVMIMMLYLHERFSIMLKSQYSGFTNQFPAYIQRLFQIQIHNSS